MEHIQRFCKTGYFWLGLFLMACAPALAQAQTVSGTVFRDYNGNGTFQTATEIGQGGLTVSAYDATNTLIDQVTSAADGTYTLTVGSTAAFRVELTGLPSFLQPAPAAGGGGTVKFVNGGSTGVNFGVSNPADVFLAPGTGAITMVTNCYVTGDNLVSNGDVLATFPDNAGSPPPGGTSPAHGVAAVASQVGPTWGLAHQRTSNSLFAGAFMKRHVGFGPSGTGAIYRVDMNSSTVSTFLDLNALFGAGTAGADPHPAATNFTLDPNSFDEVGKASLGDIDISDDELTIWAINLTDRQLYQIPLGTDASSPTAPTAAQISRWPFDTDGSDMTDLSGLLGTAAERDQDIRPFALAFHDGLVYVGLTGTAQSTVANTGNTITNTGDRTQLRGYVYSFDPSTQVFAQVLSFPLDYAREHIENFGGVTDGEWNPWVPVWDTALISDATNGEVGYPQPWLSDIEFDRGDMIIGIRDRMGDQGGYNQMPPQGGGLPIVDSGGDVLRASPNGGTWTIESNAAGSTFGPSAGAGNGQGPGNGEFYFEERYLGNHNETSLGGLAQMPGFDQVMMTVYDPINLAANFFEGGILWLDNNSGATARGYRVYDTDGADPLTFGKGNGLGDLEPLAPPAAIEVGNYVWCDDNADGVQDPNESGIANVTVELWQGGSQVTTTTTNGSGYYFFSGLDYNANDYEIRVDLNDAGLAAASCENLTIANQGSDLHDSDADDTTNPGYATIAFSTGAAGHNLHSLDMGLVSQAKLGNFVWEDLNGNGVFDNGETPIQGATVQLCDANGNPIADLNGNSSLTTDVNGEYCFFVDAGTYIIKFPTPNGYETCAKDQGVDDTVDSDYDPNNNNQTDPITIAQGATNNDIDACFFQEAKLGNFVWEDLDGDGVFDNGEPAIQGATVELCDPNGASVADLNGNSSLTTDANGEYCFFVAPGDYTVKFPTPNGYEVCAMDQGADDQVDSDYDPNNNNQTGVITMTSGETDNSVDACFFQPAKLGNFVWSDENGDGVFQNGETPIQGATVQLCDANGNPIVDLDGNSTLTTDANGEYCFNVQPGTYIVKFPTPNGFETCDKDQGADDELDSDYDPNNNNQTDPVTIASGETNNSIDAAFKSPAKIGNFVWDDSNGNGIFENGELPIQGATVQLCDANGNPIADINGNSSLTTDANGEYCFFVTPGTYIVKFPTPNGYETCDKDQGNDDEVDSDYDPNNGNATDPITVSGGETNNSIDAAFKATAKLGNFVWEDFDGDGVFDNGETPIQGATVQLCDENGNSIADVNGNSSLTTDANGEYCFFVKPGTYIVKFPTPVDYVTCDKDQGSDDELDSDYDPNNGNATDPITIVSGETNNSIDAAFKQSAKIGNFVWEDTNGDGVFQNGEPPIVGATVNLCDENGSSVTDLNGNSSLTTDANGEYCFIVKPGTYIVKFPTPTGYVDCDEDLGNDDQLDSDYDPDNNNQTPPITVTSNETNNSIDAAFKLPAKIGNLVWNDYNQDGIQNGNEPGIPGVTVNLLDCNGNPATDINGNASTVTNADGEYCFDVKPGCYIVEFVNPDPVIYQTCLQDQGNDDELDSDYNPANGQTGQITVVSGETNNSIDACYFIPSKIGDFVWEDIDGDGVFDQGEPPIVGATVNLLDCNGNPTADVTGASTLQTGANGEYCFNVLPGCYIVEFETPAGFITCLQDQGNDDGADSDYDPATGQTAQITIDPGEEENSIDACFTQPAKLGNFVWMDDNRDGIFDNGEQPIEDVKINLLDANGNPVQDLNGNSSLTTNAQGEYCFDVAPGTYIVEFCEPEVTGYSVVFDCDQDQGTDDELDSDYNPADNQTDPVALISAEINNSVDGSFFLCDDVYVYGFTDEDPGQMVRFNLNDPDGTFEVVADVVTYFGPVLGGQPGEGFPFCEPLDNLRGAVCVETDNGLKIYVITTKGDQATIMEVNPITGEAWSLVNLHTAGGEDVDNIRSLAWCDDTGKFYGVQKKTNLLVCIDPATGETSYYADPIVEEKVDRQIEGLAFRMENGQKVLYGVDEDEGDIYSIDWQGNGEGALVCETGIDGLTSIEFGANGEVFASSRKDGLLYVVDMNACTATPISNNIDMGSVQAIVYKPCPIFDLPIPADASANTGNGNLNPSGGNMALNASVSASTSDDGAASNAVDGDMDSEWESEKKNDFEWFMVDLGMNETVGRVTVAWHSKNYAEVFDIEVSTDGSSWTTVASMTRDDKGTDEVTFAQVTARYVRVYMTQGRKSRYSIDELEVYESNIIPKRAVLTEEADEELATVIPGAFTLHQNYPNPFNPTTLIRFELPEAGAVKLTVYNTAGQLVRTLVNGAMPAGVHSLKWDARDERGKRVTSGLYLYRIEANGQVAMKKMTLMK